jgi:hypothetical protein
MNQAERAPHNQEPVSEQTRQEVLRTMQRMIMLNAPKHPSLPDKGRMRMNDRMGIDFKGDNKTAVGSGQIYDKESGDEFVIWQSTETKPDEVTMLGEQVHPLGFISLLTAHPEYPDESLSLVIVPTEEGQFVEFNEGRYMSNDPVTVRELGDSEVQELLGEMQDTIS